jgi:putative oxidoreductase
MGMSLRARLAGPVNGAPHWGLLVLRLWFGLVLAFGHGVGKIANYEKFVAGVGGKHGIPLPELTAPFAIASEFLGGILLAVGLFTRAAAVAIIGTMFVVAFWVHGSDPFMKKEFALAYAVAAIVVLISGPGKYSLDARR